jgi:two-component system sensor histidine kinase BaeS
MPSVRINSMRVRITITILVVILLSWLLGMGSLVYFARQEANNLRREVMQHRESMPPGLVRLVRDTPITSGLWQITRIGTSEVLLLPVPLGKGAFVVRLLLALALALAAGAWLSRRITRSFAVLEHGAQALQAGEWSHRIPVTGDDEFARVAATMNNLAARVAAQIAELENDAARRRQLLADIAHELRSPVASLQAMTGALRDGVADEPARRACALQAMVESAERLQRLVNDVLDLAKIDMHELPLTPVPTDVRALASSCVLAQSERAHAAGIILHPLALAPSRTARVDAHRLAQVIDNVLDNAISYAGEGAQIWMEVEQIGETVRLRVIDTGRGIAPEHMPHLFDAFYRADTARTPGDGHSGLGLRIARGLVEAHGGTLHISSEEGHGTTVEMVLPNDQPTEMGADAARRP